MATLLKQDGRYYAQFYDRTKHPQRKRVADSFDAFAENIEQDPNEYEWELVSVYSVDLNPEAGGEHVHANFAIESTDPSGDIDSYFLHEHYYIIEGKIIWLVQYKRDNLD